MGCRVAVVIELAVVCLALSSLTCHSCGVVGFTVSYIWLWWASMVAMVGR